MGNSVKRVLFVNSEIYPYLPEGTCRFLVFDFDNHEKDADKQDYANTDDEWIEEVEAMRKIEQME